MTTKLRYIIQNYITGIYTIDMVFLSCGFQTKFYLTTDLDSSLFSEGHGASTLKFGAKWSSDDKWNEYNGTSRIQQIAYPILAFLRKPW